MRKRIGNRVALISAIAMLATEVLSPVAVIAAEDVAVESGYVELSSQEEAYAGEPAVEAEVEEVQAADSESVEVSGEEESAETVQEACEEVASDEENLEADVAGDSVEGSIDLSGQIWVGEAAGDEPGVLTLEKKTAQIPGGESLDYTVINVLAPGEYYVFCGGPVSPSNVYINVADNVDAKFSFGNFGVDNERLAYVLGKNKTSPLDKEHEGVSLIQAGSGSKITLLPVEVSDTSEVGISGGGFISQKGSNSVIDVNLAGLVSESSLYVSSYGSPNIEYDFIVTEGTINMNSGNLDISSNNSQVTGINVKDGLLNVNGGRLSVGYMGTGIDIHGGTLNVTGGTLYVLQPTYDGVKGTNGTVNVKDGRVEMTEVAGDGIDVENVDISGGDVRIDTQFERAHEKLYTSGSDSTDYNTLSFKDGVFEDRLILNPGSHKAIKAGERAKTVSMYDTKNEISVPASGSVKISGGMVNLSTVFNGLKCDKIEDDSVLDKTDAGVYIIGAPDDAIYSGKDVEITGGDVFLFASDRGIRAGENVTIANDANLQIPNCYKGIEGKQIVIGQKEESTVSPNVLIGALQDDDVKPFGEIWCMGDGICASSAAIKEIYYTENDYTQGIAPRYVRQITPSEEGNMLKTYSGNVDIYIASEETLQYYCDRSRTPIKAYPCGNGINCYGKYDDRGGFVRVYGDSHEDKIPFKTNNDFIFTNGPWMLGTGADKDGKSLPTGGAGVYLVWGGKTGDVSTGGYDEDVLGAGEFSFSAGEHFVVKDSKDELIYEDILPFGGTFIIFGCPMLKPDEKYKVTVGDKEPKELTGLRKDETDPEDDSDNPEDDPQNQGDGSISRNNVLGYDVNYNKSISYNGAKIYLPYFEFGGAKVGGTLSNNTIIFKKIKYKNNKFVGTAQMRLQFKAAKTKKDGSKFSKEEKAKIKAEVKKLNDYFKKNYLTFEIVPRQLLANEIVEVKGTYKAKKSKFSIKLRVDTKATNAKGKALKPIKVKEVKKSGKGDFEIDPKSFNEKNGTVVLKGKNNFTGTCTVKGIVAK